MADISKRTLAKMDASDLGFAIGPRLNAAGRLNDMALGVRCLLENDNEQAFKMASQLNALNSERRASARKHVRSGRVIHRGNEGSIF